MTGYPFYFQFYIWVQIFIAIERKIIFFLFWVYGPLKDKFLCHCVFSCFVTYVMSWSIHTDSSCVDEVIK